VQLVAQGFRRFVLSVNYRAEVIEEYFGSGSRWGIDISYVREPKRLGTAGSLRLLTERPTKPLIVMNGDILTKLDVRGVLEFHEEKSAAATMCVREHEYQVPFGVVQTDGIDIAAFDEKPVVRWPVNAGIYVLSPSSLDAIPSDTFFDMPALFDKLRETAARTVAYTIRDFWMDIGRPASSARTSSSTALTIAERDSGLPAHRTSRSPAGCVLTDRARRCPRARRAQRARTPRRCRSTRRESLGSRARGVVLLSTRRDPWRRSLAATRTARR
jgi:NDP-sugar pyrophosphorylase family protein